MAGKHSDTQNANLNGNGTAADPAHSIGKVDSSFYIVGVGASAGGLSAIKSMLGDMPEGFSHSIVIVQHLSPDHDSLMGEILRKETAADVCVVENGMPLEPGKIYLLPPKWNVVIQGTSADSSEAGPASTSDFEGLRFALTKPSPRNQLNLPIDLFFSSLAEAVGSRAVGVVLSGTGTDGSRGLRSIKEREGIAIVQDPDTAEFDGMPFAALATTEADFTLPPTDILPELSKVFELERNKLFDLSGIFENSERDYQEILKLAGTVAGISFETYKEGTLKRRIVRRMGLTEQTTLSGYLTLLTNSQCELETLHRELLVGVTAFFRDPAAWDKLSRRLPELFEGGDTSQPVKIWCIGCSTGEEPYSVALLLETYRQDNNITRDFKIIASDVNSESLEFAKRGIYPLAANDEIPKFYRRQEFLSFASGSIQIASRLRRKIIFTPHNVIDEAPYIHTDLIICRNVLIYLSAEVQSNVLSMMSYSLRKGGLLFLGSAETTGRGQMGFAPLDQIERIYSNAQKNHSFIGLRVLNQRYKDLPHPPPSPSQMRPFSVSVGNEEAHELLKHTFASLDACLFVLDTSGNILETFGNYRKFLSFPNDGFSTRLLDLLDPSLRSTLLLLLRSVEREEVAEKSGLVIISDGEKTVVDLICRKSTLYDREAVFVTCRSASQATEGAQLSVGGEESREIIAGLQREISSLEELLAVTTHDLSVTNEQLQAANEELLTANEELQANNEEMQSTNEELHTINMEANDRIAELETAYSDIENLLSNTDLGILFLDGSMRIRRFSKGIENYFDLTATDFGRPLTTFTSNLTHESMGALLEDTQAVLDTGETRSRNLRFKKGGHAILIVRPFIHSEGVKSGAVVKLVDVSELVDLQEEVRQQRDALEGLLETETSGWWDWNIPGHTEYMSPRFKEMFGYQDHEVENTPDAWMQMIHPDDLKTALKNFDAHVQTKGAHPYDQEVRYFHKDGHTVWVLCRGHVTDWSNDGEPLRMMGVHVDITHLREREADVQRRAEEIRRFAFVAAHDLVQPSQTIQDSISSLVEDMDGRMEKSDHKLANFATKAAERLSHRISGILEYARLQDNSADPAVVDLDTVIKGVVEDLSPKFAESKAEIRIASLPQALGQPALLGQVFQNILSNALKFRRKDTLCRIELNPVDAVPGTIAVRIADNGIGIAEEDRERIFELFVRLHAASEYEGSGLGLSISRRIVEQMKGGIRVETGIDGGAAFVVTLPAVAQP